MSQHCRIKAGGHVVKHVSSGRAHFFSVTNMKTDKEYSVMVQVSCDCPFMSIAGQKRGKICSHILAAAKLILETGGLDDFCRVPRFSDSDHQPEK